MTSLQTAPPRGFERHRFVPRRVRGGFSLSFNYRFFNQLKNVRNGCARRLSPAPCAFLGTEVALHSRDERGEGHRKRGEAHWAG
jgi:hypothetical protein